MKKLRWQLIIIFLTGMVVGILLLGEQPGKIQPFSLLKPNQGGIYTEALVGTLQRLNPLLDSQNAADRDIDRLIFSGLIRFDGRGLPQPDMAESWGISQDGTLYNVSLRNGIRWHDGQLLTSEDVIFTIDLFKQGGPGIPTDLQEFWKNVEVIGNGNTLQFRLPEPFAPFLDYLTFGVLPKHLLGTTTAERLVDAAFNVQPVGSGPFKFDHMVLEDTQIRGVVLKANAEYYGKKPYLEQIVFMFYPDSTSALKAYTENRVQGISQVTPDALNGALAENNLGIYTGRKPEMTLVLFNLANPETSFLQDAKVRKALYQGINRQFIIDRILQSQAFLADGPILPGTWAFYDGTKKVLFDPDAARRLLIDDGYVLATEGDTIRRKEDQVLQFNMVYPDDEQHRQIAESIQKNWADINVQVNLEALPYDQLLTERLQQRTFQAALVDLNLARSPDPDPYPFWHQAQITGGQNYSGWDHRNASEYLEQARVTTDMTERARLYRNFQVVWSEELPALPLFYPVYTYAVDHQIQGVRMGPMFDTSDRFSSVLEWFVVARQAAKTTTPPTPTPGS